MIDRAAIMNMSVRHDQHTHLEHGIVACRLIERLLGNAHAGGLAFDKRDGSPRPTIHDNVGPFRQSVQRKRVLHGQQGSRTIQVMHEMIQEMLPDPFLGGKRHPTAPNGVEHPITCGAMLSFDTVVGQR